MRRAVRHGILLVLAGVCVSADPACASKSRTPITSRMKKLEIPPEELRIRVRALIRPTLGIVEEAGDRIRAQATDPVVRRGALQWKIETTTTLLSALLRNDPVLALADAWGYTFQVRAHLESPSSNAMFGEFAGTAAEAMAEIEADLREFAAGVGGSIEDFETRIRKWADAHPIEGALYRRPSMDAVVAQLLTTESGGGTFAALGSLEETTADVMTRMDLYTMYLPRLARWEAELAVDDLAGGIDPKSAIDRFGQAADKLAALAEGAPDLVARERAAAFAAVRLERIAATRDLQDERRAILEAIHQERLETLADVEAMVQRLVDRAAAPLQQSVHEESVEIVRSVEEMRKRLIEDAGTTLNDVVDHAFVKALQLLLIAAALGAVGLFLYPRLMRR